MRIVLSLIAMSAILSLSACNPLEESYVLPEGDVAEGRAQFVEFGCIRCHVVVGSELPAPAEPGPVRVQLGSRTGQEMSYGQLVTAIVNPSHRLPIGHRRTDVSEDGKSRMISYNDVMTVTQLTDIVAFLQSHYTEAERPGYQYPVFDYGSDADADPDAGGSDP